MRKLRLGVAAGIIAAIAALVPATPASADVYAGVGAYLGNASTPGGLWFPASPFCPGTVPCPNSSTWTFASTLDVIVSNYTNATSNPGAGRISGSGSLTGWCGHSTGTGRATIEGHTTNVFFVTVGGTGVLVSLNPDLTPATPDGHTAGALVSTFQARPIPSTVGLVPCVNEPAVDFTIVGVGAGAAA